MSGAQLKYDQSEDKADICPMDYAEVVDDKVCTIHSDNIQLADVLAHQVLETHGDNEVQCIEARPGSDSSGRPCATSPDLSASTMLADHRSSPPAAQQNHDMVDRDRIGANISSECPSLRQTICQTVVKLCSISPTMSLIISTCLMM